MIQFNMSNHFLRHQGSTSFKEARDGPGSGSDMGSRDYFFVVLQPLLAQQTPLLYFNRVGFLSGDVCVGQGPFTLT